MSAPPLTLEAAQARLLALVEPLPIERADVAGALGRYLAEPLVARRTSPARDLSAMDGYAVGLDDLTGPWRVVGESAAGAPLAGAIGPGAAARISTGAVMPEGAGAVIAQEDVARDGETIRLAGDAVVRPGQHVRRRATDFAEHDLLLAAGARMGPAQLALALGAGRTHVTVRRSPRLAIFDTGDELCPADERCAPHQIPATNGAMLAAMALSVPCDMRPLGHVGDRRDALVAALDRAGDADVIVTSGGASVGDHDLLRPALAQWGGRIDFWRIAIKPGKPLLVATREHEGRRQLVLGLPGNPGASFVTAYLFVLPVLRALLGAAHPLPMRVRARLGGALPPTGDRRTFVRARWDGEAMTPRGAQDSGVLGSLALANALIDQPAGAPAVPPGGNVAGYLLDDGGMT